MRIPNRTADVDVVWDGTHISIHTLITVIPITPGNPQVHLEEDSFYLLSLSKDVGKELTEQYNFSRTQQQDLYRDSWMTSLEENIRLYIFKRKRTCEYTDDLS